MNHEQRVDELLRELREGPVLLAGADEIEAQRGRLLPILRERVREIPELYYEEVRQTRRRRVVYAATALMSMAAAVALFIGISKQDDASARDGSSLRLAPGGAGLAIATAGESSVTLAAPIEIAAQGELSVTADSELTTSRGVQIALSGDTRVGLDALASQHKRAKLRLVGGKVRCAVPPLTDGESFSVVTKLAEVVVHGTEFTVEADSGGEPRTCVRVTEGLVEVRHAAGSAFVSPGASWGCDSHSADDAESEQTESSASPEVADVSAGASASEHVARVRPKAPQRAQPESSENTGTLGHETRLFADAIAAERRGENALARELYQRLLSRYPASPLAPDARAGAARVK